MRTAAKSGGAAQAADRTGQSRLFAAAALVIPILILFGPVLLTDRVFAMRDGAHFYYPLYEWTTREWAAGRIPLWNPQENLGVSVLGESTSAIFYPGQLLFALPLDFALRYKLYIISHVFLAAFASYYLARRLGTSRYAAAMAGISYSCGGSILFQYCNVPFLIGAAWLPLALAAAYAIIQHHSLWAAIGLAVCLAMMVLGGDPQAAYHTLLLAGLLLVARTHWFERPKAQRESTNGWVRPTALLLLSSVCTFLLGAIQILPSYEWMRTSERAIYDEPRNIYEAVSVATGTHSSGALNKGEAIATGLVGQPKPGTHQWSAYEFSIGPWRLAEFVWPNVGGRMFPTNRRWFSLIPAESRVWSPSLYMGLIPLSLALGVFTLRSPDTRVRWLSWTALIFVLGSLGWFGIGWAAREIYAAAGGDENSVVIGSPVGGIYWLLMTMLPMYAQFRYPAKLFVVAALAISQLSAIGLDRALTGNRGRPRNVLAFIGIMSGAMAILVCVFSTVSRQSVEFVDPAYGPFDVGGAWRDAFFALAQSTIVAAAAWWLLRQSIVPHRNSLRRAALVALVAVDLIVASSWMIVSAPATTFRSAQLWTTTQNSGPPRRIYRPPAHRTWPTTFEQKSSMNRPAEIADWERQTLAPKHHLAAGYAMLNSSGTLKQADYEMLLSVARAHGWESREGYRVPHWPVLHLLACDVEVLATNDVRDWWAGPSATEPYGDYTLMPVAEEELPQAWVVHGIRPMAPLAPGFSSSDVRRRTEEILFPPNEDRDFEREAVVETSQPLTVGTITDSSAGDQEACEFIEYAPERVRIETTLNRAGFLVLADAYAPGWTACDAASGKELPILRTNRVMRGVWLPAGTHTIEFRYQPQSFRWGALISAVAWNVLTLTVCLSAFVAWRRAKCCSSVPA